MRFWSSTPYENKSQAEELIEQTRVGFEKREFFQWGIANAEDDKIIATPTVVKQLPTPLRKIIGDLSNSEKVLLGLDLVKK